ncbi:tRNA uridine-5-carboxymethylaminomethyl(34) synthesis GTPase MnmE [Treponema medium]|uniref:tRNA uridine-5-carboxymethylaminomethyl(34) synthesis GTPase MnmE n=1 Tax=Treponema medium TaxID=58231 RepID=UPI00197DFCE6|nr:tRNA uridine-5-carboxymethylaminomethyl(34) synthesis GTPase MnmE [Treponema medium]QSH93252.1 tRNA uridine-5-carboxymethylaminomethyl(34) synthesis GTPase MnmE [Treponema medium]
MNYTLDDEIAAIATALAPAALGIVRTSGARSLELISRFFSRPNALLQAQGHTLVYGWIHDEGVKVDEVVLCVYRAPKSNTGENAVEILCHGGPGVVKAIYRLCIKNGFRPAERGEFTFRSFIHGKTDLTRAEAVREIIDSKTNTAQQKAAGRLSGNVFREIETIKTDLMTALAALEVGIEYPEDEETIADSFDEALLKKPLSALQQLAASWQTEKIYQAGVRLVLAGKTNAGKSSLFNALLKEDRAIVSDIHGTTRDWLEAELDFKGIPAHIFDTAGLRVTEDTVEAIGVQRSVELASAADIVLYLIDGTKPPVEEDSAFIEQNTAPLIIVQTKADKGQTEPLPAALQRYPAVSLSSKTGIGIDILIDTVVGLVTADTALPMQDAGVSLGTERQKEAVTAALEAARHALEAGRSGYPLDAVIQDVEEAVHALGSVTGEVRSDDILDKIFSGFCVGK